MRTHEKLASGAMDNVQFFFFARRGLQVYTNMLTTWAIVMCRDQQFTVSVSIPNFVSEKLEVMMDVDATIGSTTNDSGRHVYSIVMNPECFRQKENNDSGKHVYSYCYSASCYINDWPAAPVNSK